MSENAQEIPERLMDADEFVLWAEGRDARYELRDGQVVRMQSERMAHVVVKQRIFSAFHTALKGRSSRCTAFGDGPSVRITPKIVCEPDAMIACGPIDPDSFFPDDPVVVVEVISPSSAKQDQTVKYEYYFDVPSIVHYLIVNTDTHRIVRHSRVDGEIGGAIFGHGAIELDPPGISFDVEPIFEGLPRR